MNDRTGARIVVVGAGQAGAALVSKLRSLGHRGPLTLVGVETDPPYQRPPLSKAYLKGEFARERLYLRPASYYVEEDIDLITGVRARAVDRTAQVVALEDGRRLPYDMLALTLGATPRRLPAEMGGDLDGVLVMRGLTDADALAGRLRTGANALVIGGGYIGLEAAAVLIGAGLHVTLIEAAPRILARVAAPATADFFRALHRGHGVDLREGTGLTRLEGTGGRLTGAVLSDGSTVAADVALTGIGVVPETELAAEAGLDTDNGIAVDECGRTSDPDVFAAGDCASFPYGAARLRLESVPHAIEHAEAVAANMLGAKTPYAARPWFWSDQYDVKLQIAGLNAGWERTVTRPGARAGGQSVWYYAGTRLLACDAMNDPKAYMTAKRWIEAGLSPDLDGVADADVDLRTLA